MTGEFANLSIEGFDRVMQVNLYGSRHLCEALHYELKPLGIRVLCLCPGEVDTPMVAAEHKSIHPATWAQKKLGGTIPVGTAVRDLIKGLRKDSPVIVTGGMSRAAFWINRLMPPSWWFAFNDATVAKALRNMK